MILMATALICITYAGVDFTSKGLAHTNLTSFFSGILLVIIFFVYEKSLSPDYGFLSSSE